MRKTIAIALLLAASFSWGADPYPSKSVRIIVPFGAGGGATDMTARTISQTLSEQLGKSFVVENHPGAGGIIGNTIVVKSAPDGYTLLLMDASTSMVPSLYKPAPFDAIKDFTPVTGIISAPEVLLVQPSFNNINTLKDFIQYAQANPTKLNYASGGAGGAVHIWNELFKSTAKINVTHIPYKSGAEMVIALLGGHVQMLLLTVAPPVISQITAGKVKALAVTTSGKRLAALPEVPSMVESGLPGMVVYAWFGLVGPAGMPREIANRLQTEVTKTLELRSVKEFFVSQGAEVVGSTPDAFGAHIRSEVQRWAEVIKAADIKLE